MASLDEKLLHQLQHVTEQLKPGNVRKDAAAFNLSQLLNLCVTLLIERGSPELPFSTSTSSVPVEHKPVVELIEQMIKSNYWSSLDMDICVFYIYKLCQWLETVAVTVPDVRKHAVAVQNQCNTFLTNMRVAGKRTCDEAGFYNLVGAKRMC